jgi:hypothetical protein
MSHHPIASDTPASAGTDLEHSGPNASDASDPSVASDAPDAPNASDASDPSVASEPSDGSDDSDDSVSVTSGYMEEEEEERTEYDMEKDLARARSEIEGVYDDLRIATKDMMHAFVDAIMYLRWHGGGLPESNEVMVMATELIERFGVAMDDHSPCKGMRIRSKEEWLSIIDNIRTGKDLPHDLNRTDFVVSR